MAEQPPQPINPRPLSSVARRLLARARTEWSRQQYEAAERSLTSVLALAPDATDVAAYPAGGRA